MRSKTSLFNKTIYKDILRRFWPIWFIYGFNLFCNTTFPLLSLRKSSPAELAYMVQQFPLRAIWNYGCLLSFIAAAVIVMAVYSFLYIPKQTSLYTTLPVSKSSLFWTAFSASLTGLFAANVLIFLLTILAEIIAGSLTMIPLLQWLAIITMMNIVFLGIAVFCGMLTGNIIVMPLVYAVLNVAGWGFLILFEATASSLTFGLNGINEHLFMYLSPLLVLLRNGPSRNVYLGDLEESIPMDFSLPWRMLIFYCIAGMVMAVLAWLLYKKRHEERVTDTVAFDILKPLFRICMTVGCAFIAVLFLSLTNGYRSTGLFQAPFIQVLLTALAGGLLGYFISEVIVRKSFHVFSKKSLLRGGILTACVLLLLTGIRYDIFKVTNRIPASDKIESVMIYTSHPSTPSNGSTVDNGYNTFEASDPQWIEQCRQIHRQILDHEEVHRRHGDDADVVDIRYVLKNGKTLYRSYKLDSESSEGAEDNQAILDLLNTDTNQQRRQENILRFLSTESLQGRVGYYTGQENREYSEYILSSDQLSDFINNCLIPDLSESSITRFFGSWEEYNQNVYNLSLQFTSGEHRSMGYMDYLTIYLPTDATRSVQWIQQHLGLPMPLLSEIETEYVG